MEWVVPHLASDLDGGWTMNPIYLSKERASGASGVDASPSMEFTDFFQLFDFSPKVHWTKKGQVWEILESDGDLLADLAASVVRQMHENNLLKADRVIRWGLEFCSSVLQDRGYEVVTVRHLHDQVERNAHQHTMLVAGCQGKEILRERVRAAFEFLNQIHVDFEVVFSGKNPAHGGFPRVRTRHEARKMEAYYAGFLEKAEREDWPHHTTRIEPEGESRTSAENIRELLEGDFLSTSRPNHIFLVSSTFHLVRLSSLLEKQTQDKHPDITRISLIGAEDPVFTPKISQVDGYVKSMFFQLYSTLLNDRRKFSALAAEVAIEEDHLALVLRDGRRISVPCDQLSGLKGAKQRELDECEIIADGVAIRWPKLNNTVILVQTLLADW